MNAPARAMPTSYSSPAARTRGASGPHGSTAPGRKARGSEPSSGRVIATSASRSPTSAQAPAFESRPRGPRGCAPRAGALTRGDLTRGAGGRSLPPASVPRRRPLIRPPRHPPGRAPGRPAGCRRCPRAGARSARPRPAPACRSRRPPRRRARARSADPREAAVGERVHEEGEERSAERQPQRRVASVHRGDQAPPSNSQQ